MYSKVLTANFSSEADTESMAASESVQELYEKMVQSVEAQTMPPNALLLSMISSCSNQEDIKLLFQILQKLELLDCLTFAYMRTLIAIFACELLKLVLVYLQLTTVLLLGKFSLEMQHVASKCLKSLTKHNVYGLSPTIASAHYVLIHAKSIMMLNLWRKSFMSWGEFLANSTSNC